MRKGKFIAVFLTIMFTLAIPFFLYLGKMVREDEPISFYIQSRGNAEKIKCWENEEGKYYVFLPSYADMRNVTVSVPGDTSLRIGDVAVKTGTACDSFLLDTEYDLSGILHEESINQKIIFVRSANVHAMYIDTQSGSMDHIHEEKGNEEPGWLRIYAQDGQQVFHGELESIKGRGNTTWYEPKKPYSLRLPIQGNLLNMGAAQNWILLANTKDDTHLLNKLAYDLARDVGMPYTPDCEWVDLYLNGEYVGLYLLTERVEVHSERVDISKERSFLVSKEVQSRLEEQGYPHIVIQNNMALRIHHSSVNEVELQQFWQTAVDAVLKEKNWEAVIDVDSWAMRMLVDEIFGNGDGGLVSQFYYGNLNEGKIYAGPVWDMDLCLAQTGWPGGYTNAILTHRNHVNWHETSLFGRLYQIPEFHTRMIQIYKTVFLSAISELLDEKFMIDAETISQAALINSTRWNTGSFQDEVEQNYTFLKERIAFLNEYWTEEEDYCVVHIEPGYYGVWGCFAVKSGEEIPPVYGDNTDGWYVLETEKPFEITQPIYEDVAIYHRDSVNAQQQEIERDYTEEPNTQERIHILRIAPVFAVFVLLLLIAFYDLVCRKMERKGSHV